jgi:hypothetical protein
MSDKSAERIWSVAQLYEWLPIGARAFQIIICADADTTGSLWTRDFVVDVDYEHRVIRLKCEPT